MTESISRKFSRLGLGVSETGTLTVNSATATKWATARTLTLSGDLSGNVSIDGSENVTLTATVSGNTVALGTDTTGDYVASVTAGTGITATGTGEGAAVTVALSASGVTANSYGSSTAVPVLTIDTYGRITSASTASVSSSINIAGDTGTDSVSLISDTLTVSGGTGLSSTVTNNTVTLDIDNTVATLTGSQTLTNKTISGGNNTITNIGNGSLTNSSITINGASIALGGSGTLVTDDVAEDASPVNLWFTNTRARNAVSATDAGGDGSFTYDSGTGVFTYTGPSATEVRAHFSAGTGVTITNGQVAIGQAVGTSSNVTFNDVIVSGNLTVSGTTTTINTETLNLADNIVVFNSNETGTPSQDAGIEIERGTSPNVSLLWDEANDRWTVGSQNFLANTFIGALSGNATTATTWATGKTIALTGDVTGTSAAFDGSGNLSFATTLANSGVTAGTFTKVTVDAKGRVTTGASLASGDLPTYTGTLTSSQVTTALGYTPYNATNPNGYTTNTGTVTSVSGTGTASGLTLSGTVTTSGNLTLSGTVNSLAAGTYAISISGNAATATSATTAGALTSMNISQFTNNSGYITGLSFDGLSSKTGGTGTYTTSGDFRAPIFYDSNDTGYYFDGASTSALNYVGAGGGTNSSGTGMYDAYVDGNSAYFHTPQFRVRRDSSATGAINQAPVALFLHNENGTNNTWVKLSMGGREAAGSGNTVSWAGIAARKTSGTANSWASGELHLWTKSGAAQNTGMVINPDGLIGMGTTDFSYTQSDNTPLVGSRTNNKLFVSGSIQLLSNDDAIVFGRGSASFFKDEEIGFGWGGGLYMVDGTYLRVRNGNTVQLYSDGIIRADGSMRSVVFYDQNDTGYYVDPRSASVLSGLKLNGVDNQASGGDYILWVNKPNNNDWGIAITGQLEYQFFYDGAASHSYGVRGLAAGSEYWRVGTDLLYHNSNIRAPIFYDNNDTGYYLDPTSTTAIRTIGSWRADSATWDGEFSGKIQYHSSHWYFQSGNLWIFRNSGGSNVVTIDQSGVISTSGDMRSPIFYDSANTGYYVDPAGTARLSYVLANGGIRIDGNEDLYLDYNYGCSIVGAYASTRYQGVFAMGSSYRLARDGTTTGSLYGLAWSHPNAGGVAGNLNTHGLLAMENGTWLASLTGSTRSRDDMRAPLFYDNNNTGYYVDPASTSNLNSVSIATLNGHTLNADNYLGRYGNSYYQVQTWLQFNGTHGLYWPSYYGAHLYINTGSTYTQIRLDGSKNSYDGMWLSYSAVNGMMYDGGGNGGVYREANGRWYFYYHLSNDCMGIGTSSTSSTYSLYLNKGVYAQSRIDATIFYDSDNTGYYFGGGSGSCRFNDITIDQGYNYGWWRNYGSTGLYNQTYGRGIWAAEAGGNSYGCYTTYDGGRNGWAGWGIGSRHVFMSTTGDNVGVHDNSRGWIWYWDGSYTRFDFGYTQFAGSGRAPIFYDSNDTGYYCDPASTSYMYRTIFQGRMLFYGADQSADGTNDAQIYFTPGGGLTIASITTSFETGFVGSSYPQNRQVGAQATYDKRFYVWQDLVQYYSDERLKEKTGTLVGALDAIKSWTPFKYVDNALANSFNFGSDKPQIGLSAQEVQQYYPELVELAPFDVQNDFSDETNPRRVSKSGENYLTLNYTRLVPVLVQAIKEQQAKIEELERRINNS